MYRVLYEQTVANENERSEWTTKTPTTTLAFGQFSDAAKAGHWTLQPAFDKFEPSVSGNNTGTFLNNLMDMNMGLNVLAGTNTSTCTRPRSYAAPDPPP